MQPPDGRSQILITNFKYEHRHLFRGSAVACGDPVTDVTRCFASEKTSRPLNPHSKAVTRDLRRPIEFDDRVSLDLPALLGGHQLTALAGTGADYTIICGKLVPTLKKVTPWTGTCDRTAGGHVVTRRGRSTTRLEIRPSTFVLPLSCSATARPTSFSVWSFSASTEKP